MACLESHLVCRRAVNWFVFTPHLVEEWGLLDLVSENQFLHLRESFHCPETPSANLDSRITQSTLQVCKEESK